MFKEKKEMLALISKAEHLFGKYSAEATRIRSMVNGLTPTATNVKLVEKKLEKFEKGVDKQSTLVYNKYRK